MTDQWGPGNKADAEGFELGHLDDGLPFELIMGEHPHSRQDNNIYARFANKVGSEGENIVGFDGHRILVKLELRTMNYLKTSWMSGDEVRKGGFWQLWLNGYEVYSASFRDPFEALLSIRTKMRQLMDLPVNLWKGETPVGRKVYWRNTPATITSWLPDQGCVILTIDGEGYFPPSAADKEEEYYEKEKSIKDDILTPNIWWWRKDKSKEE